MFDNYDGDKEHFDNLDKDMKIHILFENAGKKEHYDKFINLLNNCNGEKYINEVYKDLTLLQHVHRCKNDLAFKLLLDHPKIDLHVQDKYDETILYKLIETDAYELFTMCIERMDVTKIDTNFKSANDRNLLHLASTRKNPEFLKVLLALPCSHNLYIKYDNINLLQIALCSSSIETFKVIYELWDSAYDINIYLPLHCAVYGEIDMIKFVLNLTNIDVNKSDEYGRTALHKACQRNSVNVIELFLKDDRIDVNLGDYQNMTPFYIVCDSSYDESIKLMLDYSKIRYIDLNKPDKDGVTPFHCSLKRTDVRTKMLLEFDGDIDYNLRDKNDNSPFYSACCKQNWATRQDRVETVKMLLNDDRIDKSDIDKAYQKNKDNNIKYMTEILDKYLNHKN